VGLRRPRLGRPDRRIGHSAHCGCRDLRDRVAALSGKPGGAHRAGDGEPIGAKGDRRLCRHAAGVSRHARHQVRSSWDTVGSYGIPAGIGLAALARYVTLVSLGFHDTSFGDHVAVGLHAVAVDEHRRPFVPTFWTIAKGQQPKGHVEQTWFAGAHCNVGGGYPDPGLSDQALIWMIARLQALTGLEFDSDAVKADTHPNIAGSIVDSTIGWPIDHAFRHYRTVLSPVAIHHGYAANTDDPHQEHINERVHWSVVTKRQARATAAYNPLNLPADIPAANIAAITDEERELLDRAI
jgi:hypothetical protein